MNYMQMDCQQKQTLQSAIHLVVH